MAESALNRLIELSNSLPNASLRKEQKELLQSLARELKVNIDDDSTPSSSSSTTTTTLRPTSSITEREEKGKEEKGREDKGGENNSVSSARDKFQKGDQEQAQNNNTLTRREARKSTNPRSSVILSTPSSTGNSDCDISASDIKNAYEQVRDDSSDVDWMALGYGSSKKILELHGSGKGGLKEFTGSLKEDEITYGYVRVIFGDSQRSKFVFITFVPENMSMMNKARANTHKPAVTAYLKYMHIDVYATTKGELDNDTIQTKLKAAAGANYGTGGTAAAGSEDFGSIKDNAKTFFQQTEGKGNRQSIVYNKGPLADTTPVSLQGRAGITDKYIKV